MMGEMVDAVDRISELPPHIIHQIMSYLPIKQVVRTGILSKRWNHLWKSFPILDFDQTPFVGYVNYRNLCLRRGKRLHEGLNKFIKFVDGSLRLFCQLNLCIKKFTLLITLPKVKKLSLLVDKWIGMVVENGVKELDICCVTDLGRNAVYTLNHEIFSATLLTTLKLSCCKVEQPSNSIMLCSLKKLTLDTVYINDQMLQKLTGECPLLEVFLLCYCWGLKHLCISKALKLKTFEICSSPPDGIASSDEMTSLEIIVPSLPQFRLQLNWRRRSCVVDMAGCRYLNKLRLESANFTAEEFHHIISQFPLLEDLSVSDCNILERITISRKHLKKLEVSTCANLKAIHVDTPNLLSFCYISNPLSAAASINAPCPWKIFFETKGDLDTRWFFSLKEFLAVSKQIEDLTIYVRSNKISFNLDEVTELFPCQVENLKLNVDVPLSEYIALLNGLLWTCYPRTLSVGLASYKFLEWVYEKLSNRDTNCCNSCHIKCWQHYLKDVKINNLYQIEEEKLLENLCDVASMWIDLDWSFPKDV